MFLPVFSVFSVVKNFARNDYRPANPEAVSDLRRGKPRLHRSFTLIRDRPQGGIRSRLIRDTCSAIVRGLPPKYSFAIHGERSARDERRARDRAIAFSSPTADSNPVRSCWTR